MLPHPIPTLKGDVYVPKILRRSRQACRGRSEIGSLANTPGSNAHSRCKRENCTRFSAYGHDHKTTLNFLLEVNLGQEPSKAWEASK